jgi:hypothetical protein
LILLLAERIEKIYSPVWNSDSNFWPTLIILSIITSSTVGSPVGGDGRLWRREIDGDILARRAEKGLLFLEIGIARRWSARGEGGIGHRAGSVSLRARLDPD